VVAAMEESWPGPVARVDLYSRTRHPSARGRPLRKMGFAGQALYTALTSRPELVLSMHVGLLPVALLAGRLSGAATGLWTYGTEVWGPMPAWQASLIRRCTHLIAISGFTRDWLSHRSGTPAHGIAVIPLPIDDSFMQRASNGHKLRNEPHFVTVARVVREHRYKGHFLVADRLYRLSALPSGLTGRCSFSGPYPMRTSRKCMSGQHFSYCQA
jgi:hypothetical protein